MKLFDKLKSNNWERINKFEWLLVKPVDKIAVAIDFFNENSKLYSNFHKEGEENNYEHVLSSSLEVLIPYSCDDSIASYALGYSYKTKFRICGNLSLDDYVLFLHGIDEVVSTYKTNVKKVSL
mgnify:CR=1 FL=1